MNQPQTILFPDAMAAKLRELEAAKQQLIAGYMFGVGLDNVHARLLPDLSGLTVEPIQPKQQPPTEAQP